MKNLSHSSVLTTVPSTSVLELSSRILSSNLFTEQQISVLPESGLNDQFFHISEKTFMSVFQGSKAHRDVKEMFDIVGSAEHTTMHPGDLFFNLFFHKGLDYFRNTCMIFPHTRAWGDDRFGLKKSNMKQKLFDLDAETLGKHHQLCHALSSDKRNKVLKTRLKDFYKRVVSAPDEYKKAIDKCQKESQEEQAEEIRQTGRLIKNKLR
ncbi:hypothetical protein BGZ76_002868 [Entomortierella beljakovae]|nr:hypothetical protein BGZ76_002868 [Entomortierella beljakovae]